MQPVKLSEEMGTLKGTEKKKLSWRMRLGHLALCITGVMINMEFKEMKKSSSE